MERVRSKDVLAVMGLLCVNKEFRAAFFANPRAAALGFVGSMSAHELKQIEDLAGYGEVPGYCDREAFISRVKSAYDKVCSAYECPMRPCPEGDPDEPPSA